MSYSILVVDDEATVIRSVTRVLERAGHTVHQAANRTDARRRAIDHALDVALVDYALGREDGLTVMADLQELQPNCLRVLMTGNTDFPMVVEAVNRGEVVRVLQKPFKGQQLLDLVDDAVRSINERFQRAQARLTQNQAESQSALDECLRKGLLRVALQPIVRVNGSEHKVVAYEALMRPQHALLDNPLKLLRAAEDNARINEVGSRIFERCAEWYRELPSDAGLFVNLHPGQLADPDRLRRDLSPLLPHASRTAIEITERARVQDIKGWDESIGALSDLGFKIAVDDLGAGYNSLNMLAELNPHYIKLDMSLVRNINMEPRKQRLVQLLVTFSEATGATSLAEGVETEAEARVLQDIGIDLMQGWYYGRPRLGLHQQQTA